MHVNWRVSTVVDCSNPAIGEQGNRVRISAVTQHRRAAVVGDPIEHSLSPVLHNAAYAAMGLTDWRYDKVRVPQGALANFVAGLDSAWAGLSVTMPLKREALALAGEVSEIARVVGAANTLLFRDGEIVADNTDVPGMLDALATVGLSSAQRVVVLGAGGTAQATMGALSQITTAPVVAGVRDRGRAGDLVAAASRCGVDLQLQDMSDVERAMVAADLVISTLPGAAADHFADVALRTSAVVFDVVYKPWPTRFADAAAKRGCSIVSGLELLLQQAGYQVRLMTGRPVPLEAMRYALGELLRE